MLVAEPLMGGDACGEIDDLGVESLDLSRPSR